MLREYVADGMGAWSDVEGIEGGKCGTVCW